MDREKVIKGLEYCKHTDGVECPNCPYWHDDDCVETLHSDIIELLKEQDAKTGHWIVLEYCANEGIYCSECHTKIFNCITKPKDKLSRYCPHCGSRNEQFFRDGEVVFR